MKLIILLLAMCSIENSTVPMALPNQINEKFKYICDDSKIIMVEYINLENESMAIVEFKKNKRKSIVKNLPQIPSGSGVKYSDGLYIWWSKGDEGFLTWATGNQDFILRNCKTPTEQDE